VKLIHRQQRRTQQAAGQLRELVGERGVVAARAGEERATQASSSSRSAASRAASSEAAELPEATTIRSPVRSANHQGILFGWVYRMLSAQVTTLLRCV
jgi:hypothetical protein